MKHKVRILGDLELPEFEGEPKDFPTGLALRAAVALAIRPGEARSVDELTGILWPNYGLDNAPELSVEISRARKGMARANIELPKGNRGSSVFMVRLKRSEVDLTDFIDSVESVESLNAAEVDQLLGLWRTRPEIAHSFLPSDNFLALARARSRLIAYLATWGRDDLAGLRNLGRFRTLYEVECAVLPSEAAVAPVKKLLLVDDDERLTLMVAQLLAGYSLHTAHDVGAAMAAIADQSMRFDGALVDLHLTSRGMDSQGLQVLDALRIHRPAVPRILMTSSPPADALSHLQREYDLYEILVKNSKEAPVRTRRIVDEMMSDAIDVVARRAKVTLDTLCSRVESSGMRLVVAARQGLRRGTATQVDLDAAMDELELITDRVTAAKAALVDASTVDDTEAAIVSFSREFAHHLRPEVAANEW